MIKTHDFTGFHAYWIYVAVKNIHFGGKYDITRQRLPQKARFLKSWNDGRKDRDGMMFLKIMERIPARKSDYIRCFATYYMQNPSFHVSDILNDNFQTFKTNELELGDILETVKSDYLTVILHCHEKNIDPQKMFYGTAHIFPLVFRLYDRGKISVNSLIAFHEIFGIGSFRGGIEENIVEAERAKKYRLVFDKYSPIVYNYFKDIAWKKEIQAYHHYIMKYGR